jgi:hexosaminidase
VLAALVVACAIGAGCTGSRPAPVVSTPRGDDAGSALTHVDASAAHDASIAAATRATLPLVPPPRSAVACDGSLAVGDVNGIIVDEHPAARAVGLRLAGWLGVGASAVRAIAAGQPGPSHAIVLRLDAPPSVAQRDVAVEPPQGTEDEAYTLDITPERALIHARHPAGLFYAAQTLAQLARTRPIAFAPPVPGFGLPAFPCVHIEDAPVHRVRAMHLDVARHFFTKELVERYVDLLSFYRFNVFHWHLTDDQGFRLAIRKHPELTQVGAPGGSYSQSDAREVVAFAQDRFVTVVPEIEMPGHVRAILASHPELSCTGKKQDVPTTWGVFDDVLCAGNEGTYALLGDVLRETTEVFPSNLVHIGGDEVPKARWSACPKCRARMAKEGLTPAQLQGVFTKRAGSMLAALGRRAVAWDDALEGGVLGSSVIVAWQNAERGRVAALAGHQVVMAPSDTTYFNYWQTRTQNGPGHQGYLPWTKVLAFDPVPPGLSPEQSALVLGGEGALWTEYVTNAAELDTLLLPRLAALSDALWSGPNSATFVARFTAQRRTLDASGVRYFVEPPVGMPRKKVFIESASLALAPPALHPDGVVRFTLDGSEPGASSPIYDAPIVLRAATSAAARLFLPGGRASDVVRGVFEPSAPRPAIHPSMDPAMFREGVIYKYFEGDFHALPDVARFSPRRTGRLPALSFDPAFRPERFAVLYDAWLVVPADGVVRFVARADDGVRVDVDGVRVLDDDGEHAPRDAAGEIALARGPHTVRVLYFQGAQGKELSLACEGAGMALGRCPLVSP